MKNKAVIKDDYGMRWFVTKKGKIFPTNWKMQAALLSTDGVKKKGKKQ